MMVRTVQRVIVATALATAGLAFPGAADAAVIYRETFGNEIGTGNNDSLYDYEWALHLGNDASAVTDSARVSGGAGKPADLANTPSAGEPSTAYAGGYLFARGDDVGGGTGDASRRSLHWTVEYAFNPGDYAGQQIEFSWYQGHSSASTTRLALRIGAQWYVTDEAFANTPTGSGFSADAPLMTFTFTDAASAWRLLNFDGDESDPSADGSALAMGTVLGSSLPSGQITAFGLYMDSSANAFRRYDTVQIEIIPEPRSLLLLAAGVAVLLRQGRRKAS